MFCGASLCFVCDSKSSTAAAYVVQPHSGRRRVRQTHVLHSDNLSKRSDKPRHWYLPTSTSLCSSNEGDGFPPRIHDDDSSRRIDNVRRIFAISDLHTDSLENMQWLVDRCTAADGTANENDGDNENNKSSRLTPGPNDALIIAGDISHDLDIIRDTLSTIVNNLQCHTFFIPGNHEAWIGGSKMDGMGLTDSFAKLEKVVEVCDALGVHTTAKLLIGGSGGNGDDDGDDSNNRHAVWVVPMWSWYDGSLVLPGCEDLSCGLISWPWVDFKRCDWGEKYQGMRLQGDTDKKSEVDARFTVPGCERVPSQEPTKLLLSWNDPSFEAVRQSSVENLITFSHFLPSQQTLPDWKEPISEVFRREDWLDHPVPDVSAKFAYVAGSDLIDEQIRSIWNEPDLSGSPRNDMHRNHIHVFGHSHRPKDFVLDGIRYIHNPVGKPVEREMNMINNNFDFELIWDHREGQVRSEDVVIRYWEQYGGGVELLVQNMAKRRGVGGTKSIPTKKKVKDRPVEKII